MNPFIVKMKISDNDIFNSYSNVGRSAPDIRRRTTPIDKLPLESDQKGTSFEQINSQNLSTQMSNNNLSWKQHSNTTSKSSSCYSIAIYR